MVVMTEEADEILYNLSTVPSNKGAPKGLETQFNALYDILSSGVSSSNHLALVMVHIIVVTPHLYEYIYKLTKTLFCFSFSGTKRLR